MSDWTHEAMKAVCRAVDEARVINRKRRNLVRYKLVYLPVDETGKVDLVTMDSLRTIRDENERMRQHRREQV